ncbi:MAG: hypothetical protein WAW39_01850 [Prosthecobacter sp.]|uniref:hypothetical protein n=1 Tax=Prosthecobacter sp. TaxID=1965333 RepID=UPI003BB1EDCA
MSTPTPAPTPEQILALEQAASIARHRRYGVELAACPAWMEYVLPKVRAELSRLSSIIFDPSNRDAVHIEESRQRWFALTGLLTDLKQPVIEAWATRASENDELVGIVPPQVIAAFDCKVSMASAPPPQRAIEMPPAPDFDPFSSSANQES